MEEEDTDNFDDIDAEVPKVSVNGRYVPLHEITEDDQRQMTTEEYQVCQNLYLQTLRFATKYYFGDFFRLITRHTKPGHSNQGKISLSFCPFNYTMACNKILYITQ